MSNLTLYNISADFLRIVEALQENDGELTPEIEEALLVNDQNFIAKTENYIEAIAMMEAYEQLAADREKEFQAKKRKAANAKRRLKERLQYAMELMGRDKVEIGLNKLSLRESLSVNITDEARIPAYYIKVETKINKDSIRRDLKAGIAVEGAELLTTKSIQIR